MPSPKLRRYLPPVRTSISHDLSVMPIDFGTHHFLNSSGLDHASNTRRAGASNVRVTTSSRSDFLCTVVRFMMGSPCFLASIQLFLPFQFFDDLVQLAEPCVPELVIPLDPRRHFFQSARADPAGAYAADFFRDDEPRLLEEADVLLHAREGHVELLGQVRDRRFRATQLLEDAATGDVRQRGERGIEAGVRILNHLVQYLTQASAACKVGLFLRRAHEVATSRGGASSRAALASLRHAARSTWRIAAFSRPVSRAAAAAGPHRHDGPRAIAEQHGHGQTSAQIPWCRS